MIFTCAVCLIYFYLTTNKPSPWTVLSYIILFNLIFVTGQSACAFDLYGHRGARGLSPENTLPAYVTALAYGVDYVDMDVALTRDNQLVVQHDLILNPVLTRNSQKQWLHNEKLILKNLLLPELKQYDVGRIKPGTAYATLFAHQQPVDNTSIPSLQETIAYVKNHAHYPVGFQIELKTDPAHPALSPDPSAMAAAVAKIITHEGIRARTQVQAYDWRCLLALQKIDPQIATAYITDRQQELLMRNTDPSIAGLWTAGKLLKNYHDSIPQMIKALGGRYWDPEDQEVKPEQIREAHRLGLKVIVWSDPEASHHDADINLSKKLIAMGVDGIITDRPDLLRQLKNQSRTLAPHP